MEFGKLGLGNWIQNQLNEVTHFFLSRDRVERVKFAEYTPLTSINPYYSSVFNDLLSRYDKKNKNYWNY